MTRRGDVRRRPGARLAEVFDGAYRRLAFATVLDAA